MKRAPRIEVFQDAAGAWRWHLRSANGRIIAQGESHGSERDARRSVETARRAFALVLG